LKDLFEVASLKFEIEEISDNSKRIYALQDEYIKIIDSVFFLQGKNPTLALKFVRKIICQASRFAQLEELDWALGLWDAESQTFGTLYPRRYSDFIVECVDANFGFSRYERLGRSANSFDENCIRLCKNNLY
jgi:hypothetical protein